ncbi:MAG TPA: hypothetical protein VHB21_16980 [Minicystis sp.]|nr:hypothetical protein [Minicystis sp.]
MIRSTRTLAFFAVCFVGSLGCQVGAVTPEGQGFTYLCGSGAQSDAACNELPGVPAASAEAPLPDKMAAGSSFRVAFWPSKRGSPEGPLPVLGESKGVMSPILGAPGAFRIERPGSIALVALGPSDEVLGRARLEAFAVDHLGFDRFNLQGGQPSGAETVTNVALERVAERVIVRAVPMNAEGDVLGGTLPCAWSSSNPAVVTFEGGTDGNVVTIVATGAGATALHVTLGGKTADLPVTVGAR